MNRPNKITCAMALFFLFISYIFFPNHSVGIFFGAVWGFLNLFTIKKLVLHSFHSEKRYYLKIFLLSLLKFPLLYAIVYWLLIINQLSPLHFLIGFSGILIISMQQHFWNALQVAKNIPKKET